MLLPLWITLSALARVHCQLQNITIDDTSSQITYAPASAWGASAPSPLDYGGSHTLSSDPTATATFSFVGVAFYFLSPLWPYSVSTDISIDSGSPSFLDLQDYSRPATDGGPETVQSNVVWSISGLANVQHTVVVSMPPNGSYVIVDGLIFTSDGPVSSTTFSSTTSTSTSSLTGLRPLSTSSSASATPTNNSTTSNKISTRTLAILVGSIAGALALGILALLILICKRRRQGYARPHSQHESVTQSYPTSLDPRLSAIPFSAQASAVAPETYIHPNHANYTPYDPWQPTGVMQQYGQYAPPFPPQPGYARPAAYAGMSSPPEGASPAFAAGAYHASPQSGKSRSLATAYLPAQRLAEQSELGSRSNTQRDSFYGSDTMSATSSGRSGPSSGDVKLNPSRPSTRKPERPPGAQASISGSSEAKSREAMSQKEFISRQMEFGLGESQDPPAYK